jgi:FkbM family methyltransferase
MRAARTASGAPYARPREGVCQSTLLLLLGCLHGIEACICTPALFTRLPMQLCNQLVEPFCAAIDVATARGLSNATLVVDVGAAYGLEAIIARQHGYPVLSFECRLDEFQRLLSQFHDDKAVKIEHACVSDHAGSATLHRAGHASSLLTSSLTGRQEARLASQERQRQETARLVVLDEYLVARPERLGVLKIDVQGYESAVLRGARHTILRDRPYIFYEETFHRQHADRKDGRLLWEALGTNASYACECSTDCFCQPTPAAPGIRQQGARRGREGGRATGRGRTSS